MICILTNTNPPSQKNSAVIVNEIDNGEKVCLTTTATKKRDFKSQFLFRPCSGATNLVTSFEFYCDLCYYAVPFLANYGTVPNSLIFTTIAAMLLTVLQENTKPFQNGQVGMRNKTVLMSVNDAQ